MKHAIHSTDLVDLHTHTDESDGTYTPEELVKAACEAQLSALAVTDHDTFNGFFKARPFAAAAGLELICGIELNSKLAIGSNATRSAHVLAYFPGGPGGRFTTWLETQQSERRQRNALLAERLQAEGMHITLEEVERRGKSLAGRPHFARILVEKGYATNTDDAFRRFIGEDAPTFVDRQSPSTEAVIAVIRAGGGIPVLAHPIRLWLAHDRTEEQVIGRLAGAGLIGLEVYHSEQSPELQAYYGELAERLHLAPSGGSDFHGTLKPDVVLGSGRNGNVRVPRNFLDRLLASSVPASI